MIIICCLFVLDSYVAKKILQGGKEYKLYKKYFAQIMHTLTDIDTLLPYLISKEVINAEDVLVIKSKPRPSDQVCELLMHIDGPLSVNETTSFYSLLDIMEDHGCITTKQLANAIKGRHIMHTCTVYFWIKYFA